MNLKRIAMCMLSMLIVAGAFLFVTAPAGEAAVYTEGWLWPVEPLGSEYFTKLSRGYTSSHNGIDVASSGYSMNQIHFRAMQSGTVYAIYTGCNQYGVLNKGTNCKAAGLCSPSDGYNSSNSMCNYGFGNGVVIKHTGKTADGTSITYYSQYAHMSYINPSLKEGQAISQGTYLGNGGASGNATGVHLHFEVNLNKLFGTAINVNPLNYPDGSARYSSGIWYNYTEGEEVEVEATFSSYSSKEAIGETTATIAKTISVSGASISSVTKVGAQLYDASGTLLASKSETPVSSNGVINAWYTVGSGKELDYALTKGTTYKYRFFCTLSTGTQYSDYYSFTTTGTTTEPEISVSFANYAAKATVGETMATIAKTISVSGTTISSVTKVGAELYNSSGTLLASKTETPTPSNGVINAWYTVGNGEELDYELTPGTTYKYRFKATVSGTTYYSSYYTLLTEGTAPGAISVSFSNYTAKESVGVTNAVLAKTISVSGASISDVTKVGIMLYNSAGTQLASKTETPTPNDGVINAWYDVNSELGYTLSASTTYKYRFLATIGGTNYYSEYFSFTTGADSVSIAFKIYSSKHTIGSTTATLANTMSITGANISAVTQVGITLYDSAGTKLISKSETPTPKDGVINAWYEVGSGKELNYALSPTTTYKYRFHAVCNGKTHYGSYCSFTTGSTGVTVSYKDYTSKLSIGTTNAVLAKTISVSGAAITSVTSVGIELYKDGTLVASKSETPTPKDGVINAWYDVNSELSYTLTPATYYTYKFKAVIGGVTYISPIFNFTTNAIKTTGVALNASTMTLDATTGATGTLIATVSPDNASNKKVTWSSSNTAVATVVNGVVTPVSAGSAVITCTAADGSGASAKCTVTVTASAHLDGVSVSSTTSVTGESVTWTASAASTEGELSYVFCLYRDGSVYRLFDESSEPTLSYTFERPGAYYVEVTCSDAAGYASAPVSSDVTTVTQGVTSISLNFSELTMNYSGTGSAIQLVASCEPASAGEYATVSWSSSDSGVAEVSKYGVVTACASGTAVITAQVEDGPSASCTITVERGMTTLELPGDLRVIEDEAFLNVSAQVINLPDSIDEIGSRAFAESPNLRFIRIPSDVNYIADDAFSGSDVCIICEPESAAHQYALDQGIAYSVIYAQEETTAVETIVLDTTAAALTVGGGLQLYATPSPSDADNLACRWYSSDPVIASVSSDGMVTALSPGKVIITAVAADGCGASADCVITVTAAETTDPEPEPDPEEPDPTPEEPDPDPVVQPVQFVNLTSTAKATDAYIFATAEAETSGSLTKSGFRMWDASGVLAASKDETHSYNQASLNIWYNVTEETGVVLEAETTYTWQIYTVYNGTTYWTDVQTLTTTALDAIAFSELRSSPSDVDAYIHARGTSEVSGDFTRSGFRMWDASGELVASMDEASVYTRSTLEIWYSIESDTGVQLTPGQTYTWQIYTVFNGTTYWTDVQTLRTLTEEEVEQSAYLIPHPIITSSNRTRCIYPSVAHLEVGETTDAATYAMIIDQFNVTYGVDDASVEGWYEPHTTLHTSTYCNYFAADVSYAMGAFLPLRSVCGSCGRPTTSSFPAILSSSTTTTGTNTTIAYMRDGLSGLGLLCSCGGSAYDRSATWLYNTWFSNPDFYEPFGWEAISYSEAGTMANAGYLTIGVASGHVFVVHPNSGSGVYISQAGGANMDNEPIPSGYTSYSFFYNKGL